MDKSTEPATGTVHTPASSLRVIRIIWFALMAGQVAFMTIVLFLTVGVDPGAVNPEVGNLMFFLSAGLLAMSFPLGVALRKMSFGAVRPVPPGRYITGTIIFLALLEAVSLMGLTGVLASHVLWPNLLVPVAALAIQAISFPTGAPMEPVAQAPSMRLVR